MIWSLINYCKLWRFVQSSHDRLLCTTTVSVSVSRGHIVMVVRFCKVTVYGLRFQYLPLASSFPARSDDVHIVTSGSWYTKKGSAQNLVFPIRVT